MPTNALLPYYHPTTVLMVDDDQRFLRNFSLVMPDNLTVRYFHSASEALQFIERSEGAGLDQRCFSLMHNHPGAASTFQMELALIEQEISNYNRFLDISVVIVDYDMPEMNGLEFCERIKGQRIMKILLTGVGDEKVAIEAFNAGLINRFLTKNDPDISNKITDSIAQLQLSYFHTISQPIQKALSLNPPHFMHDKIFLSEFHALEKKLGIVEYYFVENPHGFLMVSQHGQLYRLIVLDDAAMQAQQFSARRMAAPEPILNGLAQHRLIAWFWSDPEALLEEDIDWEDVVFPATTLNGSQRWHYALVENPPADIEYDSGEACYASFLNSLD